MGRKRRAPSLLLDHNVTGDSMAKSKGKKRSAEVGRDATHIATRSVPRLTTISIPSAQTVLNTDRRRFNPTKTIAPLGASKRDATRIKIQPQKFKHHTLSPVLPSKLQFDKPKFIDLCTRRATRSRVLHALKKTGKTGQAKPRRNFWSNISCGHKH